MDIRLVRLGVKLGLGVLAVAATAAQARLAAAAELVPEGQRASLTLHVSVSAAIDHRTGNRDAGVKWKSLRTFDATVEMEAGDQFSVLPPNAIGAFAGASGTPDGEPRYQIWAPVRKGQITASAAIDDAWDTVFYSAGRETSSCTLKGPAVSPALTALGGGADWEKQKDLKVLANAQRVMLAVDAQGGANALRLVMADTVPADEQCKAAIAANARETRNYRWVTLQPPVGMPANFWLDAGKGSAGGGSIAGGKLTLKGEKSFQQLGPQLPYAIDAMVPVEVEVRWELKR